MKNLRTLLLKTGIGIFSILLLLFCVHTPITAQENEIEYTRGIVTEIVEQRQIPIAEGQFGIVEKVRVKDDHTGEVYELQIGSEQIPANPLQLYKPGQHVVLVRQIDRSGNLYYSIVDQYRIPVLILITVGFFIIVLIISRMKGVTSLLGMMASVLILLFYMVPQIAHGADPVLTSIIAAGIISAVIIYMGHGFHYKSHVALGCMVITLAFVGLLSHFIIIWAYISGIGDETATFLQFSGLGEINLRGLFLGGIILAALSVLDDSIVSQVSVISQLKEVKPTISFRELFSRGMEVGRDHISTLVNTLILAYAGASLPLFILFTVNSTQPAWVSLNDQMIAEEVIRTIVGSIGLVLSIPLTTFVASYVTTQFYKRSSPKSQKTLITDVV